MVMVIWIYLQQLEERVAGFKYSIMMVQEFSPRMDSTLPKVIESRLAIWTPMGTWTLQFIEICLE